jgi:hypothetical protein
VWPIIGATENISRWGGIEREQQRRGYRATARARARDALMVVCRAANNFVVGLFCALTVIGGYLDQN